MADRSQRKGGKRAKAVLADPKNDEILEVKALIPDATLEEIGKSVGLSPSAVCKRLQAIRESLRETDEVKIAIDQLRGLVPLCVAVYARKLAAEDRDVARDILKTHGLLVDRTENVNRNLPVGVNDIVEAISKLGIREHEELRDRLRTNSGSPPEPPSTDV